MDWRKVSAAERRPILLGCVGALIMGLLSCCALSVVAIGSGFGASPPPSPEADPARPDITLMIREPFINRMLVEALPDRVPVTGQMDIQPGNRLVFEGDIEILVAKVPVVMSLRLRFDGGQLQIDIESMEAAGYDLAELTGMDAGSLTEAISGPLQEQIGAGLGPGAEIMGITTDDDHLIISARWPE